MRGNIGISIRATGCRGTLWASRCSLLIVEAVKTIIVALSSTQWCHSFFRSGQISLLLFIQLVATVVVIWERCLSFVQAVCAFTNSAGGHPWVVVYVGLSPGPLVYGLGGYCPCEGSDILVLSLQQRMLSLNILSILSAPSKIICSCNAMVQKYRWVNSAVNTNSTFLLLSYQFLGTLWWSGEDGRINLQGGTAWF